MAIGRDLNHPSVQRSWSQWSEDQTLHVAVPYSNPFRWRTRRVLLENFRRQIAVQPNLRLYVGELAYGDRPFEVTGLDPDGDINEQCRLFHSLDVQMRTDCEMFHKENIINQIVTRAWPPGWKYGAWSDGDFTFTRHDWALEAIHLLQHYDFVQLFSTYSDLDSQHRPYGVRAGFIYNYIHQAEFLARMRRRPNHDDAYYVPPKGQPETKEWPFGYPPGATGGAFAFRRSAFDTVGGMLETNIIGGGDWDMAFALVERPDMTLEGARSPLKASIQRWQRRAAKLTRNVGYVEQHAIHHFHGSKVNRFYADRWKILRDHQFNPDEDLVKDWQGIFRWSGDKPRLRDDMRAYLLSRREDDPNLYGEQPILGGW